MSWMWEILARRALRVLLPPETPELSKEVDFDDFDFDFDFDWVLL